MPKKLKEKKPKKTKKDKKPKLNIVNNVNVTVNGGKGGGGGGGKRSNANPSQIKPFLHNQAMPVNNSNHLSDALGRQNRMQHDLLNKTTSAADAQKNMLSDFMRQQSANLTNMHNSYLKQFKNLELQKIKADVNSVNNVAPEEQELLNNINSTKIPDTEIYEPPELFVSDIENNDSIINNFNMSQSKQFKNNNYDNKPKKERLTTHYSSDEYREIPLNNLALSSQLSQSHSKHSNKAATIVANEEVSDISENTVSSKTSKHSATSKISNHSNHLSITKNDGDNNIIIDHQNLNQNLLINENENKQKKDNEEIAILTISQQKIKDIDDEEERIHQANIKRDKAVYDAIIKQKEKEKEKEEKIKEIERHNNVTKLKQEQIAQEKQDKKAQYKKKIEQEKQDKAKKAEDSKQLKLDLKNNQRSIKNMDQLTKMAINNKSKHQAIELESLKVSGDPSYDDKRAEIAHTYALYTNKVPGEKISSTSMLKIINSKPILITEYTKYNNNVPPDNTLTINELQSFISSKKKKQPKNIITIKPTTTILNELNKKADNNNMQVANFAD